MGSPRVRELEVLVNCDHLAGIWFARSRGKRHGLACHALANAISLFVLQWGRGFAAAESMLPAPTWIFAALLQWGRGLAAAESSRMRAYREWFQ